MVIPPFDALRLQLLLVMSSLTTFVYLAGSAASKALPVVIQKGKLLLLHRWKQSSVCMKYTLCIHNCVQILPTCPWLYMQFSMWKHLGQLWKKKIVPSVHVCANFSNKNSLMKWKIFLFTNAFASIFNTKDNFLEWHGVQLYEVQTSLRPPMQVNITCASHLLRNRFNVFLWRRSFQVTYGLTGYEKGKSKWGKHTSSLFLERILAYYWLMTTEHTFVVLFG